MRRLLVLWTTAVAFHAEGSLDADASDAQKGQVCQMSVPCDMAIFSHKRGMIMFPQPIGSMYGIYANIWGILMVNVTIYTIHGSYGQW